MNQHVKVVYMWPWKSRKYSILSFFSLLCGFFLFSYQGPVGLMGARGDPSFEGPMVSCTWTYSSGYYIVTLQPNTCRVYTTTHGVNWLVVCKSATCSCLSVSLWVMLQHYTHSVGHTEASQFHLLVVVSQWIMTWCCETLKPLCVLFPSSPFLSYLLQVSMFSNH